MNKPRLRFENPVLTKELRTRMRGARAYWILFAYVLLLSLILFFTYLEWWQRQQWNGNVGVGGGGEAFAVGKTFYVALFCTQAILVGLITPALTAGGITMEREQRTYELLSASLLPRRSIVVGKLLAAVSFVGLLLTSSLPLVSLCFLLGGVSHGEVLTAYGLLLVVALLYGAVGMVCSALSRNTSTATVMGYGILLLLFFTTLPLAIVNIARPFGGPGVGTGLGALNPIGAVMAGTVAERYFGVTLPAWAPALLLNGLLGVILIVLAIHRLEYPHTDRSGLLRALTAVFTGLLAFFVYGFLLPGGGIGGNDGDAFLIAGILTVLGCCVLVGIFATGDGLPEGGVLSALDPRRLRRGEAPSGMAYALLLAALCLCILLLGAPENVVARAGQRAALLLLSFTFCFGAAGLLFSALLGNRWGALAFTLAAAVVFCLLPMTALMRFGRDGSSGGSALDNTLYLSPFPAIVQLGGRVPEDRFWRDLPPLWGGHTPFYVVTPILYGGLGVVFLITAQRTHNARRGKREVSPAPVPLVTS